MKKLLALLCAGTVLGMFNGCTTTPTATDTVTISGLAVADSLTAGGSAAQISGKLDGTAAITSYSFTVETQGGTDVTSMFTITYSNASQKTVDLAVDGNATIKANSTTNSGMYTLKVTATIGTQTFTGTTTFRVSGINGATVTIGSYQNTTYGSSIDLDNGTVLFAAQAKADGSGVDLVCTYSSAYSTFRIFNPVYAADTSNITAFSGWVNPANTQIVKAPSATDWNSITTKAQIKAIYDAGSPVSSSDAAEGDIFVVFTDQSNYVAIQIVSFDADVGGTANIKYGE
jgi:hypothetical protein